MVICESSDEDSDSEDDAIKFNHEIEENSVVADYLYKIIMIGDRYD